MPEYVLRRQQLIPRRVEETFPFFADAGNLEIITPPWLRFHIVTPRPIAMKSGTLIDYRLKWHGVPITWRTEISDWEPPFRFVDQQIRGPYRLWHHTHLFEPVEDGTLMTDIVRYRLPLGWLGTIAHTAWVRADLEAIFDYRQEEISRLLGPVRAGITRSG